MVYAFVGEMTCYLILQVVGFVHYHTGFNTTIVSQGFTAVVGKILRIITMSDNGAFRDNVM